MEMKKIKKSCLMDTELHFWFQNGYFKYKKP